MKLKRPLRGGETGADVRMVQRALNRWTRNPRITLEVTRVFDERTMDRLRAFQAEQGIAATAQFGQGSLDELDEYFDDFGRNGYARFKLEPAKPDVPLLGPIVPDGEPLLEQDLTHITDVLGWPALDDGWKAGKPVIAVEDCEVYDNTSGAQGGDAFYVVGESTIRIWVAHIVFVPKLGAEFRQGQKMTTISADHKRPHVHSAINAVPLIGRHLESHDDYTHGAPLVGKQLERALT